VVLVAVAALVAVLAAGGFPAAAGVVADAASVITTGLMPVTLVATAGLVMATCKLLLLLKTR